MRSEDQENDHRVNLRKILDEFRKSLKDEFPESILKTDEQHPTVTMVSGSKHITKTAKTRQQDENTRVLTKRERPKHTLSVLLDPRISAQVDSSHKDARSVNLSNEQRSRFVSSSLNSGYNEAGPVASEQDLQTLRDGVSEGQGSASDTLEKQEVDDLVHKFLNDETEEHPMTGEHSNNTRHSTRQVGIGKNDICNSELEKLELVEIPQETSQTGNNAIQEMTDDNNTSHACDSIHSLVITPSYSADGHEVTSPRDNESETDIISSNDGRIYDISESELGHRSPVAKLLNKEIIDQSLTSGTTIFLPSNCENVNKQIARESDNKSIVIEPEIREDANFNDKTEGDKIPSVDKPSNRESPDTSSTPLSDYKAHSDKPLNAESMEASVVSSPGVAIPHESKHVYGESDVENVNYDSSYNSSCHDSTQAVVTVSHNTYSHEEPSSVDREPDRDSISQSSENEHQTEILLATDKQSHGEITLTEENKFENALEFSPKHGENVEVDSMNLNDEQHADNSSLMRSLTNPENSSPKVNTDLHQTMTTKEIQNIEDNIPENSSLDQTLTVRDDIIFSSSADDKDNVEAKGAQAQARAEQRKNTDVHMKFGDDGLHITTDNVDNTVQSDQQPLIHPHQQQLQPSFQQRTPLYEHYNGQDGRRYMGEGEYPGNPYPNSYTTSLPEVYGPETVSGTHQYSQDGHFDDSGSYSNGNQAFFPHNNNSLVLYNNPANNTNSDLYIDPRHPDNVNRRRRLGRDHTNYILPPNIDPFKDKKVKHENNRGGSLIEDGPPGLPLSINENKYGEEGLKLVVVDKTDDEDESSGPNIYLGGNSSAFLETGYSSHSHSDVYPIDRNAVDRDLYKQVYDPTADTVKTNTSPSVHKLHAIPAGNEAFGFKDNRNIMSSMNQQEYNKQHESSSDPGFMFQVTNYDSETATDTGRTSLAPEHNANPVLQHPYYDRSFPNTAISYGHMPAVYGKPHPENIRSQSTSQKMYSISQMDYDRYTSNPSQLSTSREETDMLVPDRSNFPHRPHGVYKDVNSRTFLIQPSSVSSNPSSKDSGRYQDVKVPGPGYKFQVNTYNVAKRASILNRAEQLLDARRGQLTDRSDSSDELQRIDEDDDEDSDSIDDMNGPRHRALKHLQRRTYDESTSYNSSDDVLHNMRYHPRGPVSQAARRARLTSVNARLRKQKHIKASSRQILPPPPFTSDDDVSSSESDVTEPPSSHRHENNLARYEDPKLFELNNDNTTDNQQHPNQREVTPGPKGRRVMFYRNGDIHYRPKQVLINNKTYTNLEKLLVDLSSMVETSTGVKYIFSWPEGSEIKSITEFENGKYYVCSSTSKLQRVDYGTSKENQWKHGKIDRKDNFLFQPGGKVQSPLRRPRVLTIISNLFRDSREKLILNTNSQMNFEDILNDISNMINIPNPPVKALYTERKPHQKVESYSQLIRDYADQDTFIACGEEMVPLELSKRPGQATESTVTGSKRGSNKNIRSETVQEDLSGNSARGSGSYDRMNTREQIKVPRKKTDSVRVEISGKVREFFPPTQLDVSDQGQKPGKKLKLDWVYGYRGRDVKQNLAVLASSGELVYFVAAVVVVYNKKFSSQRHYLGHSEEITCLAVHPKGRFVASGQISGRTPDTGAHLRIWDGISLSTYAVIGLGTVQQGVACVSFSEKDIPGVDVKDTKPGDLVMLIDDSDRHVLSVWEWQTEKLVARTTLMPFVMKTTNDPVVSGCFYPADESILITYGKEHLHFWKMFWDKGGKIMRDKLSGNFQDQVPKFVTSVCFSQNGDVISGDSSGTILVWTRGNNNVFTINKNISVQTRQAHKKSVSAVCMLGDGTLLSGGGNVVKAWDSVNNYALVKERVLPESAGHVRTIVPMNMSGLDGSIYVATTRNKVLEGSLQLKFRFIIQGHVEELWAVESHPMEETFVSAGHDQTVVKWSATSHSPVWRVNVENPCTSISIDPKGRLIALGTTAGKVVILNSYSGVQLTSLSSGTVQINALSFSPDGKLLAIGTFDGVIKIFYIQDEGHNFFRPQTSALKYNNMFIMHLDWSVDSKLIQAVMGDYEIIYWNVTTMQRIKSSRNLRDVKWATQNCPIGHSLIGPWQNLDKGDVINVVSRSHNRDLQVVGDTKGRLRLYRWPCSVPKAGYRQTKVYSSNITCATVTYDDGYVITSGGNDAALMQFSVLDTVNAR